MRLLALVLTISSAVTAAAGQIVTLDSQRQARAGIVVAKVVERTVGDSTRIVGQVVRSPGSTHTIRSLLSGRVEALNVAPGDHVRAGAVMIELHSHDFLEIQGEYLRAADMARIAESRRQAGAELFEVDGISRIELETRKQEAFSAQLDMERARAELADFGFSEAAVENLASTRSPDPHLPVRARRDGVVLALMVQEDNWVQSFEPLLELGDPLRIELELQIPPDKAVDVVAGSPVEFTSVGRPDPIGRAVVISHVPQVDPETRTVRVRARIQDAGALALFPGVFVEGSIGHGRARQVASVPKSAVIRVGDGDVVFIRTGPETFETRPVDLGVIVGEMYEVRSGVAVGDEVVVEGVFQLKSVAVAGEDA